MGAADEREPEQEAPVSREAGATGEALSAGPAIKEDANGDRRIVSSVSAENGNVETEQQTENSRRGSEGGAFTAVNS